VQSFFYAPAALALAALCASCAQPSHTPVQEQQAMTSASTATEQPYRPHTLDEFPQFTAQEMGRRVLALIDSIKSYDDLTLQHIREVTGFPMERAAPHSSGSLDYSFMMYLPDSRWYYGLDYFENKQTQRRGAEFRFGNPDTSKDIYHLPSMTPVCLDFYAYVAALERMGFEKTHDEYHDLGWIIQTHYKRGNVGLTISERREADQPEARRRHACLEYVSFGS
jgi:hypothetical protein